MKTAFLFSTLLVVTQLLTAQVDSKKLDDYFDTLYKNDKFIGSVALMEKGKVIYSKQVGLPISKTIDKPNKNTLYRIGSISKMFTSVLTLKAVEEQKLALDQTIDRYYPDIPNAHTITIDNLLNHRSGIHNFTNDINFLSYYTKPMSQKALIQIITDYQSDFTPDSKAEYSNSNFVLLSCILETIYKKDFSDILKTKIVAPLNLKHTFYGKKIDPLNNEAQSYKWIESWEKDNESHPSVPLGAGIITSTPSDLLAFQKALFEYQIISKESVNTMIDFKDNYGRGIFPMPYGDYKGYGHNGRIDSFHSLTGFYPETKNGVAITANGFNYDINMINTNLLNALHGLSFEIPEFKTISFSDEELTALTGTYAAPSFPLKLTITNNGQQLIAQATGQSPIPLTPKSKTIFEFLPAGIVLEFETSKNEMTLKQGGGVFVLTKE